MNNMRELPREYRPLRHDPDWVCLFVWFIIIASLVGFWYGISCLFH